MESKKEAILDALTAFMNQRSGMDPRNYGDWKSYRAESRSVTRDLHDARTLLRAVMWRDSITADDLLAAFRAFSGRLSCNVYEPGKTYGGPGVTFSYPVLTVKLDYCTGQYFPTEYRKAVCAVLASALWDRKRADMPKPTLHHNTETGEMVERYNGMRAGDWIRDSFRREFGRGLAGRYFN